MGDDPDLEARGQGDGVGPSDLAGELLERRYGPEEGARVADELRARGPLTVKPVRGGGELRWRAAP